MKAKSIVTHNPRDHHHNIENNANSNNSSHPIIKNNHHNDKMEIKKQKKETRVTKMVLSMSLNYIIGNILASLSPILFQFSVNSTFYGYYGSVTNITSYLSHGSYLFLFYIFNPTFRRVFLETFCFKSFRIGHGGSGIKSHPMM